MNDGKYYEYTINICVIGPISVGKTSLVRRIEMITEAKQSSVTIQPSLMADISRVEFVVDNKILKAAITDTPGMKKLFHAIPTNILRNQCGYLVVFDLTDRETFDDIKEWFQPVKEHAPNFCEIFLIGNKADDVQNRKIDNSEAIVLASLMNAKYFETSSMSGFNVGNVFQKMVENIQKKAEFGSLNKYDIRSGIKMNTPGFYSSKTLRTDKYKKSLVYDQESCSFNSSRCC